MKEILNKEKIDKGEAEYLHNKAKELDSEYNEKWGCFCSKSVRSSLLAYMKKKFKPE